MLSATVPREEEVLLQHDAHLAAQRRQIDIADIEPSMLMQPSVTS